MIAKYLTAYIQKMLLLIYKSKKWNIYVPEKGWKIINKLTKVLLIVCSLLVVWYIVDYARHGAADLRLQVENTTEDTMFLAPLIIKGDAVYNLEEVSISDDTTITGIGFKAFHIQNQKDLKKGQWVRVWFTKDETKEKHAEKIVVFNLF